MDSRFNEGPRDWQNGFAMVYRSYFPYSTVVLYTTVVFHTIIQRSGHITQINDFSFQESNADLPSEYWQIQKLVKYLKVGTVTIVNFWEGVRGVKHKLSSH